MGIKLNTRRWGRDILNLTLLLILPMLDVVYKMLNNSNVKVHSLVTDIDRSLPFVKVFIIPYVTWYVFVYVVFAYVYFKNKQVYRKALLTYVICMIISFTVYFLFQTTVPRPEIFGYDILTDMVRFVYTSDKPFNCFPSIHCMSCYIIIKTIITINANSTKDKRVNLLICIMSALIMVSTLLVKQHVLLDLIGAVLLGNIVFKIVFKFSNNRFFKRDNLFEHM